MRHLSRRLVLPQQSNARTLSTSAAQIAKKLKEPSMQIQENRTTFSTEAHVAY